MGLLDPDEAEEEPPKTRPWPLNLPEEDDDNCVFTFFMKPLNLSFMSSIVFNTEGLFQ